MGWGMHVSLRAWILVLRGWDGGGERVGGSGGGGVLRGGGKQERFKGMKE